MIKLDFTQKQAEAERFFAVVKKAQNMSGCHYLPAELVINMAARIIKGEKILVVLNELGNFKIMPDKITIENWRINRIGDETFLEFAERIAAQRALGK